MLSSLWFSRTTLFDHARRPMIRENTSFIQPSNCSINKNDIILVSPTLTSPMHIIHCRFNSSSRHHLQQEEFQPPKVRSKRTIIVLDLLENIQSLLDFQVLSEIKKALFKSNISIEERNDAVIPLVYDYMKSSQKINQTIIFALLSSCLPDEVTRARDLLETYISQLKQEQKTSSEHPPTEHAQLLWYQVENQGDMQINRLRIDLPLLKLLIHNDEKDMIERAFQVLSLPLNLPTSVINDLVSMNLNLASAEFLHSLTDHQLDQFLSHHIHKSKLESKKKGNDPSRKYDILKNILSNIPVRRRYLPKSTENGISYFYSINEINLLHRFFKIISWTNLQHSELRTLIIELLIKKDDLMSLGEFFHDIQFNLDNLPLENSISLVQYLLQNHQHSFVVDVLHGIQPLLIVQNIERFLALIITNCLDEDQISLTARVIHQAYLKTNTSSCYSISTLLNIYREKSTKLSREIHQSHSISYTLSMLPLQIHLKLIDHESVSNSDEMIQLFKQLFQLFPNRITIHHWSIYMNILLQQDKSQEIYTAFMSFESMFISNKPTLQPEDRAIFGSCLHKLVDWFWKDGRHSITMNIINMINYYQVENSALSEKLSNVQSMMANTIHGKSLDTIQEYLSSNEIEFNDAYCNSAILYLYLKINKKKSDHPSFGFESTAESQREIKLIWRSVSLIWNKMLDREFLLTESSIYAIYWLQKRVEPENISGLISLIDIASKIDCVLPITSDEFEQCLKLMVHRSWLTLGAALLSGKHSSTWLAKVSPKSMSTPTIQYFILRCFGITQDINGSLKALKVFQVNDPELVIGIKHVEAFLNQCRNKGADTIILSTFLEGYNREIGKTDQDILTYAIGYACNCHNLELALSYYRTSNQYDIKLAMAILSGLIQNHIHAIEAHKLFITLNNPNITDDNKKRELDRFLNAIHGLIKSNSQNPAKT